MRWPALFRHPQTRRCVERCRHELNWLTHQLLPPHCLLCNQALHYSLSPTHSICRPCMEHFTQVAPGQCPLCAEPYSAGSAVSHRCGQCQSTPPLFEWIKSAGVYSETMAQAMNAFKYQGKFLFAKPLAQCIVDQLATEISTYQPDCIIAVPLHRQRLRERGYNQSLLLAQHIGKSLNVAVHRQAIIRTRPTQPQSLLNARQRNTNLHGAFAVNHPLEPQRILLIDDIVTTTSTVRACTSLLVDNGHTVAIAALGRASLK